MSILSTVGAFIAARIMHSLLALFFYFIIVLLANGYLLRDYILENRRLKMERTEWPTVKGRVSSTRWHTGGSFSGVNGTTVGSDYALVTYAWDVGGKTYKRTAYMNIEKERLADFPAGSEVTVYYNPRSPKDGQWELDVNTQSSVWQLLVLVNGLLLFFGILIVIFA